MANLARAYGLSPVAQALSVNYTALKGHLVTSAATQAPGAGTGPAPFVEVPLPGWPEVPQWVIELEDRSGSKLTLRLTPGDRAAVLALAQGLWGLRA